MAKKQHFIITTTVDASPAACHPGERGIYGCGLMFRVSIYVLLNRITGRTRVRRNKRLIVAHLPGTYNLQ